MTIKDIYLNPICITLTNHSYLIFPGTKIYMYIYDNNRYLSKSNVNYPDLPFIPHLSYSDRSLKQHHLHGTEKVQVMLRVQQQDPGISQDLIHPHDSICRGVYPHSNRNDTPYPQ